MLGESVAAPGPRRMSRSCWVLVCEGWWIGRFWGSEARLRMEKFVKGGMTNSLRDVSV